MSHEEGGDKPREEITVADIEEFRKEHAMHELPGDEPWVAKHNRILNYLCYRACTPLSSVAEKTPRTDTFIPIPENAPYMAVLTVARQLERELATMTRDRDARAREACTAEGRTGCSFARSATATPCEHCKTPVECKEVGCVRQGYE